MKGKKHKPEQIIKKLREADVMLAADKTIGQVTQALEISEQTFHRWRNGHRPKVGRWRDESQGGQTTQGTGGREQAAEEVGGGPDT